MTENTLMNIRTFLRGGYRDATEPTTVISGSVRLGVWLPESWQQRYPEAPSLVITQPDPRPAHPDAEAAHPEPRPVSPAAPPSGRIHAQTGSDGQAGASDGGSKPPAGRGRSSPAW